jgi:radical SAM superfamily enzyme YgiQ (UPF0313 family)
LLEKAGHTCRLTDAPADALNLEDCLRLAREHHPGLIVLDTSTPSIHSDLKTAEALKKQHPKATVVLVGNHASSTAEEILASPDSAPGVDFIASREYDVTLCQLADALEQKKNPRQVPGLYFFEDGRGHLSAPREYLEELDELPFVSSVYHHHLNIRNYFYSITQYPVITIITGRGCPFKCIFCQYPQTMHGHSYRYRSVENVVDEFQWIQDNLPEVKEIFIEDDTLTVNKKRIRRMAQLMIERGIQLPWTANSRCDVDLDTLRWMKKAKCRLLCVGVESGNDEILAGMGKKMTTSRIRQFARDARKAGVMIHGCFMVGNPGETHETLEQTFQFARELNFDTAQFFPLMVYPGTKAFQWAVENNYLTTRDYSQWLTGEGTHNCIISRPGLTNQDLVDFCNNARQRYYLRPVYIISKLGQVITQPTERRRVLKASRTFFRYLLKKV